MHILRSVVLSPAAKEVYIAAWRDCAAGAVARSASAGRGLENVNL